ncbi:L domain-like protein, partial [Martensiomyces pterosporus]
VARLSLSGCELTDVPGSLTALYNLSWLDLHGNAITDVSDISLKLGSIVRLNLAQNHLADLSGLRRLWALEILDVAENELEEWSSVLVLRNLPSLSVLNVRGNPFAKNATEDYRPLVFSAFDHRDVPLVLDGHGPTSQERREM